MSALHSRRVLRAIADLGAVTPEELRIHLDTPDYGAVLATITRLERQELLHYSTATHGYELTEKATMRRRNRTKNLQDSPAAAGSSSVQSAALVYVGGGGATSPKATSGGADGSSTTSPAEDGTFAATTAGDVVDLFARLEQEILDFDGPAEFAKFACRDEPDLWERLTEALSTNAFDVPLVADLPARRRVAAIEDALDAFDKARIGGPCSCCGAVVPPRTRFVSGGYLDSEEPSFHISKRNDGVTALCSFCHDYLASGHTIDDLREKVANAIAGVAGAPGEGSLFKFAFKSLVPMFHETGEIQGGQPWGHLTAVHRRAVELRAEAVVHPSRYIFTEGAAQRASLPGIEARVHAVPERGDYVAPVILRPEGRTPAEEATAMDRWHTSERAAFLAAHPRPFDGTWDAVADWSVLLATQEKERKSPALWRDRVGDAEAPALTRPAYVPPRITRRAQSSEEILNSRQADEREAYLAQHPRPALTGEETPWPAADGWTALLARHADEHRALKAARGGELRALEQRQAAARDTYLRSNPCPRMGGDWAGEQGWTALLAAQEAERKRQAGTNIKEA